MVLLTTIITTTTTDTQFSFLTLDDEVDDGVRATSFVDQTGVLAVIVMANWKELKSVGLRVE